MKKIIAVLMMFAVLFSLASCKFEKQMTTEELRESLTAERSRQAEESIKASKEYIKNVASAIDKIGKTEKGKKLVVKCVTSLGDEYIIFYFDKKEVVKHKITYYFFNDIEQYEDKKDVLVDYEKLVEHDESMKMVAIKNTEENERTFDELYEYYTYEKVVSWGYSVVE